MGKWVYSPLSLEGALLCEAKHCALSSVSIADYEPSSPPTPPPPPQGDPSLPLAPVS